MHLLALPLVVELCRGFEIKVSAVLAIVLLCLAIIVEVDCMSNLHNIGGRNRIPWLGQRSYYSAIRSTIFPEA